MNKTAIKNFAVWARRKLISDITYKAGMIGITENGIAEPLPQSTGDMQFFDIGTKNYTEISGVEIKQRSALVSAIRSKERSSNYKTAFQNVIEEVAYTWFNRLIAVRFMEVNDYLPSRVRVLSSENPAKNEPDFVTNPFDTDLEFTPYEQDRVLQLKDENKLDELFRMLFIKQCNKFNEILPELFEKTDDYSELLLTISFTDKDGIVYHLVHDIIEDDFNVSKEGQIEIIGWLYQYYISEKHFEVIDPLHSKTIKKEDIPAATQLFTTDWVVRYMVDNSLGRYWIERNPESTLAEKLDFFVTPKDGKINYVNEKVQPQELTFFDPCMGSGHILVYAFDVLMEIYRECGYSDRDAAMNIVQFNLHGLDIDKRAYQLAYFAVMMKARSYNRRALTQGVWNNVAAIEESNELGSFECPGISIDKEQKKVGEYLFDVFRHAKEIGSLQTVEKKDYSSFAEYILNLNNGAEQIDIFTSAWMTNTLPSIQRLVKQAEIMSKKYAIVCTNPPYMNKYEGKLKDFINDKFKAYSGDMFSVFMYRNFGYCTANGYSAFMTPNVWMFIKSYEQLRSYIISNKNIITLVQMAHAAFSQDACVDVCSFVICNSNKENSTGSFIRLSDFKGDMEVQKEKTLLAIRKQDTSFTFDVDEEQFNLIPGAPIAYWSCTKLVEAFKTGKAVSELGTPKQGMSTCDVNRFVHYWFEPDINKTNILNPKDHSNWVVYNKGGVFRKWYGNQEFVVYWGGDASALKANNAALRNQDSYFEEFIAWTKLSSYGTGFRYFPSEFLFDGAGGSLFLNNGVNKLYVLGVLNSSVVREILALISPTINNNESHIGKLPIILSECDEISPLVERCIRISEEDWNERETSWNFKRSPLIGDGARWISEEYQNYKSRANTRYNELKELEESINREVLAIYGITDEIDCIVAERDVTVTFIVDTYDDASENLKLNTFLRTKRDVVKQFISFSVGCMLGRYSIDTDGLAYAGGTWDASKYSTFMPDTDNCIPFTDEDYFEDDVLGRFVQFVKFVYGENTLEDNLDFIANALGNKGNTSREVIRNYFLNEFFKDHCDMYAVTGSGKKPIYWMFDSGKQNGFKGLVYMHRWNADTVGNLRVEYLHRMQRVYEKEIERMQDQIDHTQGREQAYAQKRLEKLVKQLKEAKDYDAKIAHIALARVDIDLDDGVKVNYEKVQKGQDGKNLGILAKI